jgi:hypothetical protein
MFIAVEASPMNLGRSSHWDLRSTMRIKRSVQKYSGELLSVAFPTFAIDSNLASSDLLWLTRPSFDETEEPMGLHGQLVPLLHTLVCSKQFFPFPFPI